jgi:DNA polymerase elongation subunit (family B)
MLDMQINTIETKQKSNEVERIIFGKNDTENIVNISIEEDGAYVYKSDGSCEIIDYSPWALSSIGYNKSKRLKGNQYYKFITEISIDRYHELKKEWDRSKWLPRSLEEGFMLLHGFTYFKGLKTENISLLSFDIEATSLDPNDKNAEVILISTTFRGRTGKTEKRIFDIKKYSNEIDMIADWSIYVKKVNPDVLLGHNILGYDLPYLNARAGGLYLGRDNSQVKFDENTSKKRKDGSQSYDYYNAKIHGREIVDTLFLSINYDIGRNFPSYGLKAIEKHLNLVSDDRIVWDFEKHSTKTYKTWEKETWTDFVQYCADDSDSPIKMFDIMIPPFFYLNQSIPKTLQQMVNEATGSQLDAMMIRSYLQDGFSQPMTSKKVEFQGAISMGIPGIYKDVRKVDVASLYPSIMLQYDIYDKNKDPNKHMLKALNYFRTERLKNKALGSKGSIYHQNLSDSQKVAINSLYGFLGAGYLLYNYPKGAADVTRYGRDILQKGVEWATGSKLIQEIKNIKNEGKDNEEEKYHWILGPKTAQGKDFTLVNVDTDSFSYCGSNSDFKEEIKELNSLYDELIKWEDDGIYDQIIVVKAKNYVLKRGEKIKYKGSSITDQKKEPALRQMLNEVINLLLTNGVNSVEDVYYKYCKQAINPKNIKDWAVKKTVTKSILSPQRLNEEKVKTAIDEAIKAGVTPGVQEGDKIWVYQAIDGEIQVVSKGEPQFYKDGRPKMKDNTILRYTELYKNDHDKFHYVERVWDTLEILKNVLNLENIKPLHKKINRKYLT